MIGPTRAQAIGQIAAMLGTAISPDRRSLGVLDGTPVTPYVGTKVPITPSVVNVRTAHGAKGDGVTDDTHAIQAALSTASNDHPKTIYLPRGVYRLTRELVVPFSPGIRIIGDGQEGPATQLLQTSPGHSILRFSRSLTHTVYMADIEFAYPKPQTSAGSMAVVYRDETTSSPSWFHHVYERLKVTNAYRGFSLDDSPGTSATVWHTIWRDCNFFQIKNSCVSMVMAKPNGQPVLWFQNIGVFNTNGVKVASNGPALTFGPTEVMIDQYDIEGWSSPVLHMSAGTWATVRGMHVEQHIFKDASAYLLDIDNSTLDLDGFSMEGSNTSSNTSQIVLCNFRAGASGRVANGEIIVHATSGHPNVTEFLWRSDPDHERPVMFENIIKRGGDVNLPGTGSRAAETQKAVMMFGAFPNGSRGLSLPSQSSLYLHSPDGTLWQMQVGNDGTVAATRA